MCFSANASFTIGASLTLVGILSLSYARQLKERMLAAIPFLFGIQQIAEGIVWKGMENNNDMLITYGAYTFLLFAFFFWPIWLPLTMYTLEPHEKRKKVLKIFFILGVCLGTFLMYHILTQGIIIEMFDCQIKYSIGLDHKVLINTLAYLIITIVPFFIVMNPMVNIMGIAVAISYLIAYLFYVNVLISVWCFFVALISFFSIYLIYQIHQERPRRRK